jgi:hypothetical protein
MGLDWIIEYKPKDNQFELFYKIKHQLKSLYESNDSTSEEIASNLEEQLKNITNSPEYTVNNLNDDGLNEYTEFMNNKHYLINIRDFRGEFIAQSELLNDELKEEAYKYHNPENCIEYAIKLELFLENINLEELDEDLLYDYNSIIKAIKWLKFWGKNGHGYSPWY